MPEKSESKLDRKRKRSNEDGSKLPASKALVIEDTEFEPHAATLDFTRGYHSSVAGHVGVRATMQHIKHAFKQGHIFQYINLIVMVMIKMRDFNA